MSDVRIQYLLMGYINGSLSATECRELNKILLDSEATRGELRELAEQVVSIGDMGRERQIAPMQEVQRKAPERIRLGWKWISIAACVLLCILGTLYAFSENDQHISLVQTSGSVTWSDSRPDNYRYDLHSGSQISSGILHVEGNAASAQLKFQDGTTLTIVGDSELAIDANVQKKLFLKRGSFSANVMAQSAGRAMRVQTPTAVVEVFGTRFSLLVQGNQTTLSVEHGLAVMQRLADGKKISVASGETSIASLDESVPLSIPVPSPGSTNWRAQFDKKPVEYWEGEWIAPSERDRGFLRNVQDVSARNSSGAPIASFTVNIRDNSASIATVTKESHLRIKFRSATEHKFLALVGLHHPDGSFAGNFQIMVGPSAGLSDAKGWRSLDIPMSTMESKFVETPVVPDNARVFLIYFACYSASDRLEIAEVSLVKP